MVPNSASRERRVRRRRRSAGAGGGRIPDGVGHATYRTGVSGPAEGTPADPVAGGGDLPTGARTETVEVHPGTLAGIVVTAFALSVVISLAGAAKSSLTWIVIGGLLAMALATRWCVRSSGASRSAARWRWPW